jgi:hypothetical protein
MLRPRVRALACWASVTVPVCTVLVLCASWEPIIGDGWGHVRWHRTWEMSAASLWVFAKQLYLHGNPRLGQLVTLLLFTPGPYRVIAVSLVELALFWESTVLALGRLPSIWRADDALAFATVTAMIAVAAPVFGHMMFYRPFTGNYVFGLVVNLGFLIPFRVRAATRLWTAPAMFVLGVVAGMCNEHTGPAVCVAAIVFIGRTRISAWMVAGLVGLVAGWLALLLAPGQDIRYAGLAAKASILGRIAERGVAGNSWVVLRAFAHIAALLPWIAVGAFARSDVALRDRRVPLIAGLGAALIVGLTLLGSPKVGGRLYFASSVFGAIAIAGWLVSGWQRRWSRALCAAFAAIALGFVGERCVVALHELGPEGAARYAKISQAPRGTTVIVDAYTRAWDCWSLGEDFDSPARRQFVANEFGLAAIELAPR